MGLEISIQSLSEISEDKSQSSEAAQFVNIIKEQGMV